MIRGLCHLIDSLILKNFAGKCPFLIAVVVTLRLFYHRCKKRPTGSGFLPTLIYQLIVLQHVCRISSLILIIFCNDSSNVVIKTSRKRHELRRRQDINSSTRNFTDKNGNKETLLRIIKLQLIPSIFSTSRINILTPISRAYMPIEIYLREANISCQYRSSNISLGL